MTARRLFIVALAYLPLALGGCVDDPYTDKEPAPAERAVSQEQVRRDQAQGDELAPALAPGDRAPVYSGAAAGPDAESTLREFCGQWANWSYRTIERQQRRLAQLATPALARELAPTASQRELDSTLARDRFAVRGAVVAIDLRLRADHQSAVCVTREEEIDQGRDPLGDGQHRVYFARLERHGRVWEVAAWKPQP